MELKNVVIYGGSFNPPCVHHAHNVIALADRFDLVIVYPCWLRTDKASLNEVDPFLRAEMIKLAFYGLRKNVLIDFTDFEKKEYTTTLELDQYFRKKYPHVMIWQAFGTDLFYPRENGIAEIDTWEKGGELRKKLNFAIIQHPKFLLDSSQLPRESVILEGKGAGGSSTDVRRMVKEGKPIDVLVCSKIEEFIVAHDLYK